MKRLPVPTQRQIWIAWVAVVVLLVVGFMLLVITLAHQSGKINDLSSTAQTARADRQDLRRDVVEQQAALDKANQKLIQEGRAPVIAPVPSAPVYVPLPGRDGADATQSQVNTGLVRLLPGLVLERLPGVVAGSLPSALSAYCAAHGECRGPAGATGAAGKDGLDGAAAAKGDPGEPGTNGMNGKDGRGIQSVDCDTDGHFVVTYTDGTEQTITDSTCRATILPPVTTP